MNLYDSLMDRMNGQQYSHYFVACCPYHHETHPSFFVYEDGTARCASCHKFVTHAQLDRFLGSHFRPIQSNTVSTNILPAWKSWDQQYGGLDGIVEYAHQNLKRYPQYQNYFKKRKIDDYIDPGRLGFITGWCLFPVSDVKGQIVDLVVRASKGKGDTRYVVQPKKNAPRPLYVPNWASVQASETIYVVYGIIDAIALALCGVPVVTGITGKSLNPELLSPLHKRFVILPDYHEEDSAHQLANSLGWRARVKQLLFPDNTKDVDDVRREYGNEYLLNLIGV